MRRLIVISILALLAMGEPARAGVYTDDLAKCLVSKTSPSDQKLLVFWIFSAISLHPDVQAFANITSEKRAEGDMKLGALYNRLLLSDCRTELTRALKYEGTNAIEPAFSVLGQVAMRGLMGDPSVGKSMTNISGFFDAPGLQEVFKEAGLRVSK